MNKLKRFLKPVEVLLISCLLAALLVAPLAATFTHYANKIEEVQHEEVIVLEIESKVSPPPVLLKEERQETVDAAYSIALDRAMRFEGFSETPYLLQGEWHIGFGRLIEDPEYMPYVSKQEAYIMLQEDMKAVEQEINQRLPYFKTLPLEFRLVLLDMGYNMGVPRLMKFERMHLAALVSDWNRVAVEMIDSLYFNQVNQRASSNVMLVLDLIQDAPQRVNL